MIGTFLKIALRNIIRNKKRTLITLSAVGFGLCALIFIRAFVEGAHKQMIENYTSLINSHIQIHKSGYHRNQKLEDYINQPEAVVDKFKEFDEIKATSLRIKAVGLVSSAESSAGVLILGIQAENEKNISRIHRLIKEGQFLNEDQQNKIILGRPLAQNLNVTAGDKVVIMSQALDGSIATGAYYIWGLWDTGVEEIDKGLVMISYKAAQDLFVMPDKASEIAVKLNSVEESQQLAQKIKDDLNSSALEVLPWQTISPSLQQWVEFDNGFIGIIVLVIMIVVAIGILNTVLMGVLERTREFGILLAIGTKPSQIVLTIALESTLLGLLGSAIGLLLGWLLTIYFGKVGIDLTIFASALNSFYIDSFVYPLLNSEQVLSSIFLVVLTSILVSIYPAWHAARLKPIEAIRAI